MKNHYDTVIVGAGIAGLLAARELEAKGQKILVLDKGRGLGGRMATRRIQGALLDHGAQFFTARSDRFKALTMKWLELDLIKPWYEHKGSIHFSVVGGMTTIPKFLAKPLDVHINSRVIQVIRKNSTWEILTANSESFKSSQLLLTPPLPQSLDLLETSGIPVDRDELTTLNAIQYHRCIAVLAKLASPTALDHHNGCLKLHDGPVIWIADNQRKGISKVPSVTIHSSQNFAEEHWDTVDSVRIPLLLEAASPWIKSEVTFAEAHRWRFSQPMSSYTSPSYFAPEFGLAIAGDGLAGGRIEGAALSGLSAADGFNGN